VTSSNSADAVLQLQGLSKAFQTQSIRTLALNAVDLTVARGEFIAISGASGCGKSTLLAVLGLLELPDQGSYQLNHQMVHTLSNAERARIRNQHIGFVFQAFHLLPEINAWRNVALPLEFAGIDAKTRQARACVALERVGLGHRAEHLPGALSGGQQQRVAIARALVHQPSLILADEPTGNLDSENGAQIMDLLREVHQQGATIVMVTHDRTIAAAATREIKMHDGRIV